MSDLRRRAENLVASTMEWYDRSMARHRRDMDNIRKQFDKSFFGGLEPSVAFALIDFFNRSQTSARPLLSGYGPQSEPQPF